MNQVLIDEPRIPAREVRDLEAALGISERNSRYLVARGVFSGGTVGRSATYPVRAVLQREVYAELPRMEIADLRHVMWWVRGVPLGDFTRLKDQYLGYAQAYRDALRAIARHLRRHPHLEPADVVDRVLFHIRTTSHRSLPAGFAAALPDSFQRSNVLTDAVAYMTGYSDDPAILPAILAVPLHPALTGVSERSRRVATEFLANPTRMWQAAMVRIERLSESEATAIRNECWRGAEALNIPAELTDLVVAAVMALGVSAG